jgi:hypothetical protein
MDSSDKSSSIKVKNKTTHNKKLPSPDKPQTAIAGNVTKPDSSITTSNSNYRQCNQTRFFHHNLKQQLPAM